MAIAGLTIIGESINDSVPSTKKLFDANDIEGLKALAVKQDAGGAAYIDVNVGRRSPEFMANMVRQIQSVTRKPLSIDTPDPELAEAGLRAYDPQKADGRMPVLNSIAETRAQMFDLYKIRPFMPILMATERMDNGQGKPNHTAEEIHATARRLAQTARQRANGLSNEQIIIDPGIAPVGSDSEGLTKRLIESMRMIHEDRELCGVHMSVGLSNFTVMLPPKRADGSPVKGPLESAFLTRAMPLGLDMVIGSVVRNYQVLEPDHPAMRCLEDVLQLDGFDAIMRVQEFYA